MSHLFVIQAENGFVFYRLGISYYADQISHILHIRHFVFYRPDYRILQIRYFVFNRPDSCILQTRYLLFYKSDTSYFRGKICRLLQTRYFLFHKQFIYDIKILIYFYILNVESHVSLQNINFYTQYIEI